MGPFAGLLFEFAADSEGSLLRACTKKASIRIIKVVWLWQGRAGPGELD